MHGGDIYSQKIAYDFSVNLNPFGCPPRVKEAIVHSLEHLQHYPDPEQKEARKWIALAEGVNADQVLLGNGASELLLGLLHRLRPKKTLLPIPCFSGYLHGLEAIEGDKVFFPLSREKDWILQEDFLDSITEEIDLVILTNPHNPTGRLLSQTLLDKVMDRCRETNTTILIDECFLSLSEGKSLVPFLKQYPNLYILKAFTKSFAIPGVRLGYLLSGEKNLQEVKRQLPEWNLSVPAQEAAVACGRLLYERREREEEGQEANSYWKDVREFIKTERTNLQAQLEGLGYRAYPSDTCFLLFSGEENLQKKLLEEGILIRDCRDYPGLTPGTFRVAVKSREENQILLEAIKRKKGKP